MARRRPIEPEPGSEGVPILPRHLTRYEGETADEYRAFWTEQRRWLKAHGVDSVRDSHQFLVIRSASERAHGLPQTGALERHRLRVSSAGGNDYDGGRSAS